MQLSRNADLNSARKYTLNLAHSKNSYCLRITKELDGHHFDSDDDIYTARAHILKV